MRLLKLGTAVVLLAAVMAPAALADKPTVTITTIDRTRTLAASPDTCRFPIVIHSTGTRRDTVYSDGKLVTHLDDFHLTYTNPATGKTVTSVLAGPEIVQPNGDGTVTVIVNGNDGHFTAPGQGSIFADVGKLVYVAPADDIFSPLYFVKSAGQQDESPFPAVCGALE